MPFKQLKWLNTTFAGETLSNLFLASDLEN
jgi:hypothetical protein